MSMWNPFKRRPHEPETRASVLDFGPWDRPVAWPSEADTPNAEDVAAVVACVNAIASSIASLPVYCYRNTNSGGREEVTAGPLVNLLRRPCEYLTWPGWVEFQLGQMLLHGQCFAEIVTDRQDAVVALDPIPFREVGIVWLPSGRIAYDVTRLRGQPGAQPRRVLARDMFTLLDRSDDGVTGRSRLSRSPGVVAAALEAQRFAVFAFQNQATPSVAVVLPPGITPDGVRRMRAYFTMRQAGTDNARRPLFLDASSDVKTLSVSPEDAELLNARRFSVEEVCRVFGVPPPVVQHYEHNAYANATQAAQWFAVNTLQPIIRKIESEFSRSVISDPAAHIEFDLSGMTRGSHLERWQANEIMVRSGIVSVAEIRDAEGFGGPGPDPGQPAGAMDNGQQGRRPGSNDDGRPNGA